LGGSGAGRRPEDRAPMAIERQSRRSRLVVGEDRGRADGSEPRRTGVSLLARVTNGSQVHVMAASFTGGSGPNGAGDRRLLAADDGGLLHGWRRRLPGAGDGGLRLLGVVDRWLPGAGDDGLLHWRWRAGGLEGGSTGGQAGGRRCGWGGGQQRRHCVVQARGQFYCVKCGCPGAWDFLIGH
jgi:hypothetical protein